MKALLSCLNPRSLAIVVTGFIIISIAYGIILTEPWQMRSINDDMDRVNDLSEIDYKIKVFWDSKGILPSSLTALNSGSYFLSEDYKTDPDGMRYIYNQIDLKTYELCSTFQIDSSASAMDYDRNDQWNHPSGSHCFFFDDLTPFIEVPISR
ncbi:MAG TPA: hypothetical protein DEZ08_01520 [Dehalococcoidia bacterium]|nr:hypothetical protein [Dehalococcoidia bacterium]